MNYAFINLIKRTPLRNEHAGLKFGEDIQKTYILQGLVTKIYKELWLNHKKTTDFMKNGQKLEQILHKRCAHANKHMEHGLTSLVVSVRTTTKQPFEWLKFNSLTTAKCWQDCRATELTHCWRALGGSVSFSQCQLDARLLLTPRCLSGRSDNLPTNTTLLEA